MRLRLGTRGSALAVAQSTMVADALRARGHDVELVVITTHGDRDRSPLVALAGAGVFAAELRSALLAGGCDFAVHSFKDLPVAPLPGLVVAAVPRREDPGDVLCTLGEGLQGLPAGSRIGTGSPRRVAQLRALRPDCEFVDIRGNIGTRLGRVAPGDLDGVVLAAAGLNRLGLPATHREHLSILPAPAQGALALECRDDDAAVRAALAELDDPASRAAALAERAVLAELGGGCAAPIGARAQAAAEGVLSVEAGVFAVDGSRQVTASDSGPIGDADGIGRRLAQRLLADGAADVTPLAETRPSRLAEFHDDAFASAGVLAGDDADVTPLAETRPSRPAEFHDDAAAPVGVLAGDDADVTPLVETRPSRPAEFHDDAAAPAGVLAGDAAAPDGPLADYGAAAPVGVLAGDAAALDGPLADYGAATPPGPLGGRTVLVPRADGPLADGLRRAGAAVWCEPLWRRVDLDVGADGLPAADWTAVTSATTVDSLAARGWRIPPGGRIAAVGRATAAALKAAGYAVDLVPDGPSSATDLLNAWPAGTGTVTIPGSALSGPELADGLRARGWNVTVVPLYEPEPVPPSPDLRAAWRAGDVAGVVVTSASVARTIDAGLGWPEPVRVVALGAPTARVLDALGVSCAVARTQDAAGVVAAFGELFGKR